MRSGTTLARGVSAFILCVVCVAHALGAAESTSDGAGAGVRVAHPETLTTEDSVSVNAVFFPAGSPTEPAPAVVCCV